METDANMELHINLVLTMLKKTLKIMLIIPTNIIFVMVNKYVIDVIFDSNAAYKVSLTPFLTELEKYLKSIISWNVKQFEQIRNNGYNNHYINNRS